MTRTQGERYLTFTYDEGETFNLVDLSVDAWNNGFEGNFPHVFTILATGQNRISYKKSESPAQ